MQGLDTAYHQALSLYEKYHRGKTYNERAAIEKAAELKGKKTLSPGEREYAKVSGAHRWSTSEVGKTTVGDQVFAERQAQLHTNMATVELLRNIEDLLIGIHNLLLDIKKGR